MSFTLGTTTVLAGLKGFGFTHDDSNLRLGTGQKYMKEQRLNRKHSGWQRLRLVPGIAVCLLLSACAYPPVISDAGLEVPFSAEVDSCRDLLASDPTADSALDASNIRLFNWNVQKKRARQWREDFHAFASAADLVLFQEASIREETIADIDSSRHWSFAPGYQRPGEVTGVMTLSGIKPLAQCSFVHAEPWLRTPKATSVTQFGLTDTDQTLVVANVHAVNFSFGTGAFAKQFEEIGQVLANHDGPIILSGDMNTWRRGRTQIVEDLANSLELTAVEFQNDHRVRFLGNALDHIYVRGLKALDADTEIVKTSDHNPMTAVFGVL